MAYIGPNNLLLPHLVAPSSIDTWSHGARSGTCCALHYTVATACCCATRLCYNARSCSLLRLLCLLLLLPLLPALLLLLLLHLCIEVVCCILQDVCWLQAGTAGAG